MNVSDRTPTDRLHLVFEDGEHFMGTLGELRRELGAAGDPSGRAPWGRLFCE